MAEKQGAFEGHGDNTAPDGEKFKSPGTFAPLSQMPTSVNSKSESGKKGEVK